MIGVVVLMAFARTDGFACSCSLPYPKQSLKTQVKKALNESRAVFSGKILEVTADPEKFSIVVKLKVERSWKGSLPEEISINTGRGGGDCGYRFEVGESYLIYAYGSDVGRLSTNICQRTAKLSEAVKDLQILGKGKGVQKINAAMFDKSHAI
jgi:hypothetical protein